MAAQNLYNLVVRLLEEKPDRRNSDKKLIWAVWYTLGYATRSEISLGNFLQGKCPSAESVRRCRQKAQEKHSHLGPTEEIVLKMRRSRQGKKGNFVYNESA